MLGLPFEPPYDWDAMLAFLAPEKPYWAVPLPIALMGLGLVLYYRLSVAADAADTPTRHGG